METALVMKQELAAVGIDLSIQSYELTTAYAKEDGGHSEFGERYWTNDILDPTRSPPSVPTAAAGPTPSTATGSTRP